MLYDLFIENILEMPLDEKRALYTCGNNYLRVNEIDTWQEYLSKNLERITGSGGHI